MINGRRAWDTTASRIVAFAQCVVCTVSVHLEPRAAGVSGLPVAGGSTDQVGSPIWRKTAASCNAIGQSRWHSQGVRLRCVIVDDNEHFLRAARELLEREGIAVVGVASTGAEALRQVKELEPELTLVDIDLRAESGLDLARRLAGGSVRSASRVILISSHAQSDFQELISASPAAGFVSKSDLSAKAILAVLRGRDEATD